jgi:CRISPR-associated protein Csd2
MNTIATDPTLRHDFIYVVEYKNCNPNGDPDMDNRPRQNPITGQGLLSDGSTKRKIRDFAKNVYNKDLFVDDKFIEDIIKDANVQTGQDKLTKKQKNKKVPEEYLTNKYWDYKMFGCGAGADSWGPFQVDFSQSVEPIRILPQAITSTVQYRSKAEAEEGADSENGTFGNKWITPHATYVIHMSYDPIKGDKRGCTPEDLEIMYSGLKYMFQVSQSTSRFNIYPKLVYAFTHTLSTQPNATRYLPCEAIEFIHKSLNIVKKPEVKEATSFEDYNVDFNYNHLNDRLKIYEALTDTVIR